MFSNGDGTWSPVANDPLGVAMSVNGRGAERVIVAARDVVKEYEQGGDRQRVLDGLSLEVQAGTFVAVMGPSGSGKSTLLHLLGGLDTPDAGDIEVDGQVLSAMKDDARTELRRQRIGIVYQFFNLVPVLTAAENVALPAVIAGEREASYRDRLDKMLEPGSIASQGYDAGSGEPRQHPAALYVLIRFRERHHDHVVRWAPRGIELLRLLHHCVRQR